MLKANQPLQAVIRQKSTALGGNQVRSKFLDFFRNQDHKIVGSIPILPPLNDPSLLFVNAGMNAWKRYLLNQPNAIQPPSDKVANSQKCVRIGDLEAVGNDCHHHTFFEMLGNWSFAGAYGKQRACSLAWEFLTQDLGLDPNQLYVTYFKGSPQTAA